MDNKVFYIIQTHSGTIPSRIIRLATRYEYSHVMISLDDSFSKMYSFGRRTVNNPLNGGFVVENMNGEFFEKFDKTECRIYKFKITEEKYQLLVDTIAEYEKNPSKYNYDIIGLLLRFFKIKIKRKNHYVCSQFVAEVIDKSSIYKFNKPFEFVKPKDFDDLSNKEIAYVGRLKEYHLQ